MQTRREQVRAYRFVTRRLVSALLIGEPETTDLPMRRLGQAIIGSVLVGAIVLAGVGVYGLLNPGGGKPGDNSLIIERETGARYVYINSTLYPVFNYASARLILGVADPPTQSLSRNSLRDLPRGTSYGIPNAPDSLPDATSLVTSPWTVCSAPRSGDLPGPATRVIVGGAPPGGTTVGKNGLLVTVDGSGDRYLLWADTALKITRAATLTALDMASATPMAVGPALINGTVAGPDLSPPGLSGDGTADGKPVDGKAAVVGTVYHDEFGQYYIMRQDGLATMKPTMTRLMLGAGRHDHQISAATAGTLLTGRAMEPPGFPGDLPKLVQPASARAAVCTTYTKVNDTSTTSVMQLYDEVPPQLAVSATEVTLGQTTGGVRTADHVTVAGQGALVRTAPSPGGSGSGTTVYLVTNQGIRYPLDSRDGDAKTALGYGSVTPTEIPVAVLELLPLGPTLDIGTARAQVTVQAPAPPRTATPAATPSPTPSRSASPKPHASTSARPRGSSSATP